MVVTHPIFISFTFSFLPTPIPTRDACSSRSPAQSSLLLSGPRPLSSASAISASGPLGGPSDRASACRKSASSFSSVAATRWLRGLLHGHAPSAPCRGWCGGVHMVAVMVGWQLPAARPPLPWTSARPLFFYLIFFSEIEKRRVG
jgi:hypothetical protein